MKNKQEKNKEEVVYRYACDACTNVAFYQVEGQPYPKNPLCKSCGKAVGYIKQENFIKVK